MPSDEDEDPRVPILCPECETTSRIPLSDVGAAVERHNEQLHDGRDVAHVDPDVADHLADLIATELGLLDDAE